MKNLFEKQKLVQQIAALLLQLIEETVAAETVPPPAESEKPVEMLTIKKCAEAIKGVSEYTVRELVRKEKIPYIKAGQGKKLTARVIQQFINDLSVNGKNLHSGEPLAQKTVIHHLNLISDVLGYAVRMEMLPSNPCSRVSVPKGEKKEKEIYTVEEIEELFALLETEPLQFRSFIILAVYSGFRRGELLGLEWKDIDWEGSVISVRRTSNYTTKRGMYTDTTKTKKSQRSLKFPPVVMDLLKAYKAEQDREREKLDSVWVDSDRLFVQWNGKPMGIATPYKWFQQFCERHHFKFCDLHSLRHFYASALIQEGVDAATVSGALGHSTISTTTSIYCHTFQKAQARAGDAIASVLDFSKKKRPGA